jgi:hypothetical protein
MSLKGSVAVTHLPCIHTNPSDDRTAPNAHELLRRHTHNYPLRVEETARLSTFR